MPETDVERLFRLLVLTLHAGDPAQLAAPVRLHDVLSRILPYRNVRRALGVDTSEDFELMLLRLAGGEAGFVATDPEPVHARFAEEAVSVNPDLGVLQEFRDAQLRLDPDAVAWVLSGGGQEEAYAPPEAGATPPPEVPQPAPPSIPTSPPATPTPPPAAGLKRWPPHSGCCSPPASTCCSSAEPAVATPPGGGGGGGRRASCPGAFCSPSHCCLRSRPRRTPTSAPTWPSIC